MPMSSEREYRAMQMAIEERAEGEEAAKIVSGYASTFDEPYLLFSDDEVEVWEQVDRSAFDNTDMSDVIMQYDHQGRVFARIRNNTLTVEPDDIGLFVRADLGGTDIGRELFQEIEGGYTDKMSFGFTVNEDRREVTKTEEGKSRMMRTITEVGKLFDVSAVSMPANPTTSISARFLDGAIEEMRAERLKAKELEEKRALIKGKVSKFLGEE